MLPTRRTLLTLALAATALPARAAYPERPLRIVVPSAAGGSPDAMMRLLAAELQKAMGQAIIIENKPGAGGQVGMSEGLRAAADGYTLTYANVGTLSINRSLFSKLNYDPVKDINPVALVAFTRNVLVVRPGLPVNNVKELVAYAQARPGKLTVASAGNGTTGHLAGEMFKVQSNTFMVHVPYRGSPQAINDLMGGQVDVMFDNIASIGAHVRSGKLRALAVTGQARSPLFPDLPTMFEAGLAGLEQVAWGGLVAPAQTPPEVVRRLNTEINRILEDPGVRERFAALGFEPFSGPPQALTDLANREAPRWAKVVQRSGAKVD
jgi:tripartite-type tricarboxylate transporter receptor subunit TctC